MLSYVFKNLYFKHYNNNYKINISVRSSDNDNNVK